MIDRLHRELNVLQTQRNILSNFDSKKLDHSTLRTYTSAIQSINTISSVLITALADILTPSHIQTIFQTLSISLKSVNSHIVSLFPAQQKIEQKQKNDNLCSICRQNIHENNIKQAKIGLQKDHRQKFRMAMEQFNRLSEENIYSKDEQTIYENQLYQHLSEKQKIFNIKTKRVQEFIDIMDSTLMALKNIQEIRINESQEVQKYSRMSSIDSYISEFLKQSFSKKVPPWISKILTKFVQFEKSETLKKQTQYGTQTAPMITEEHRQLAKQKKKIQKQLVKQSKELEQLKVVHDKLQKINKQLSKQLAVITRGMQNRKDTSRKNTSRGKERKDTNIQKKSSEVSMQTSEKQIHKYGEREGHSSPLNSFVDQIYSIGSELNRNSKRRSNNSSLFPKIRNSKTEDPKPQQRFKPFADKQPVQRYASSKFKHKSSFQPFQNHIVEDKLENQLQNLENQLQNYVEIQKTSSINQINDANNEDSIIEVNQENDYDLAKINRKSMKNVSKKKITRIPTKKTTMQQNIEKGDKSASQDDKKYKKSARKNKSLVRNQKSIEKIVMDGKDMQNIHRAEKVSSQLRQHQQKLRQSISKKCQTPKESYRQEKKHIYQRFQSIHPPQNDKNNESFEPIGIASPNKTGKDTNQIIRNSTPVPILRTENAFNKQNSVFVKSTSKQDKGGVRKDKMLVSIKSKDTNDSKIQILGQNMFEVLRRQKYVPQSLTYDQFQKLFDPSTMALQHNKQNSLQQMNIVKDQIIKCLFSQIFIDSKHSLKYEESLQKSYHKQNIPSLTEPQRRLCNQIFGLINGIKAIKKPLYQTISALLRSPYQIISNDLRFVSFISDMQEETFEYYFRRILRIHRKCALVTDHKCEHLERTQKMLLSIQKC